MRIQRLDSHPVSLRVVLLALVAVTAIPALVFSGILLQRYAESERHRAEQQLVESARGVARAIDAQFVAVEAVVRALASSPLLAEGDLGEFERRLRAVTANTGRHLELTDAEGNLLASTVTPPEDRGRLVDLGDWSTAMEAGQSYVTNVLRRPGDGALYARVIVPIRRNDALAWALHAIVTAEDFAAVLATPGVPLDWIVSIVDRNAVHLVRSHGDDRFAGRSLVAPLADHVRRRGTGTMMTVTLEGISAISTASYAATSGWAVAVGLPEATLAAPLDEQLAYLALLGAALIAVTLVVGFVVARMLDRSMSTLAAAARRVGAGAVVDPKPSRIREVRQLGAVLSQVSHALSERAEAVARLNATLEEKVATRTAELTESNVRLVAEMRRREDSEAQLRHIQKLEAVGQLTGGIAHDFNNMLAVVMSSLHLMRRRLARGETEIEPFIDSALQGTERAAGLTRRLLAFSRQQPLSPEVVDANRLVAGMSEMLRRTIPETIRIETVLAGGLWSTHADANALESAVVNLAVNARDAMAEGGRLTIETANAHLDDGYAAAHSEVAAGQYVMIAVSDTGEGMPADVVGRAFDPFFTTKPTGQGTGLGLSQVYGFVKQSGGHVKIYSEAGIGSTVKLYLPRFLGAETAAAGPAAAIEPPAGDREVVLVVEDDREVRELVLAMLEELNYAVVEAESGHDALARLDAHPDVSVLLTDVVMPDMNGRALADAVLARRPEIAVLFTTGYTRNAILHNGVLDPGVHLIGKPFTVEALAVKLAAVLGRRAPEDGGG